jgi:hypothetical protein
VAKYIDLKITNNDTELDSADNPIFIVDRDVIAQDLRHALAESGVLLQLIGEREPQMQELALNKIKIIMEKDNRIVPGSSEVQVIAFGQLLLNANTEFGPINLTVAL